jgi:hypothetical protein
LSNQPGDTSNVPNVDFRGGLAGAGHDPANYAAWLGSTDDSTVNSFWSDIGGDYSGPNRQFPMSVRD